RDGDPAHASASLDVRQRTQETGAGDDLSVDRRLPGERRLCIGQLRQLDRENDLVSRLHEVPEADAFGPGEAPSAAGALLQQLPAERPEAPQDEHAREHGEAREMAVEDGERVRNVADRLRLVVRHADDPVERRPRAAGHPWYRFTMSAPFVPPKAKPLTRKTSTSSSRASFGTQSRSHSGSWWSRLIVGETTPSRMAKSPARRFRALAAQVVCPVMHFGDVTTIRARSSPNTRLIATVSDTSPAGVEVA